MSVVFVDCSFSRAKTAKKAARCMINIISKATRTFLNTPLQTNMEPKNDGLEDASPFAKG